METFIIGVYMIEKIPCPGCGYQIERHKNPFPTVDVIVEIGNKVLLVKRRNPPHGWALPGGFIEYGESAEEAANREIFEEAGIHLTGLKQFRCYSAPKRDPRFHTITLVFSATSFDKPSAGDDAAEAALFDLDELPSPIVFDHIKILEDFFSSKIT